MANPAFPKLRKQDDAQSSRAQDSIDSVLRPVAAALTKTPIMGAAPPAWIAPDLLNGFVNLAGQFATIGFHRDCLGYVHCKGVLIHSVGCAASTTIMVFPVGYRPARTQRFAVEGAGYAIQFVDVKATGVASNDVLIAPGGTMDFAFTFLAEQ